jgi:hypothetical protein
VQLGFSGLELSPPPIESFLGIPADLVPARGAVPAGAAGAATAAEQSDWRKSVPMSKVAAFRSRYGAAGVSIDILKVDNIFKMTDAELDYSFAAAKAVGARAISTEITKHDDPKCDENHRRSAFADKHQFPVGYHGHAATFRPTGRKRSSWRSSTTPTWTSVTLSPATTPRPSISSSGTMPGSRMCT